jgi:DNA-binding MarR family transcriptional regulator
MPTATTPGSIVLLTRLARQVYRESSEEILGMTLKQFGVLNWLPDEGGIAQQELGLTLYLDPNNLVLLLNTLEDEGWIERRRDPADRRRHLVRRTPAGQRRLLEAEQAMDTVEDAVLGRLGDADRAALRRLLALALDVD